MAVSQTTLPLRLDVFDEAGTKVAERFLGCLRRDHDVALDFDDIDAEQDMPSWSTTFARAARRTAGCTRCSATRTGTPAMSRNRASAAHIFNTVMTYRDEPQSYSGRRRG